MIFVHFVSCFSLPDYDHEISVYDYYVDESGEWDPWVSKVPEVAITDHRDLLGEIFVDTVDTVSFKIFSSLTLNVSAP